MAEDRAVDAAEAEVTAAVLHGKQPILVEGILSGLPLWLFF